MTKQRITPYLIGGMATVLLLVATVPAVGAPPNILDLLCKPKKQSGLIGAICELRDRVTALESQPPVQGSQGEKGEKGDKGDQGEPGIPGELGPIVFPEPKFESDWITIPPQTAVIDVAHNVGGDPADYFIYLTYRRPPENGTYTSHQTGDDMIWWEDVTPIGIQIATNGNVTNIFDAVKIRIWVIGE